MRARLCPENGAIIIVNETETGREAITLSDPPPDTLAEGLVFVALANQQIVSAENGVVEVPEGATVEIFVGKQFLCRVEVHRNGSRPMYYAPGNQHPDGKPMYHHVDGEGFFGATRLPDALNSIVAIWCYVADK